MRVRATFTGFAIFCVNGEPRITFVRRGDGLEIHVSPPGKKSWRLRFQPGSFLFADEEAKRYEVAVAGENI